MGLIVQILNKNHAQVVVQNVLYNNLIPLWFCFGVV